MFKIGVLALQGSVVEHINSLNRIDGVIPCEIKQLQDLKGISGIILPGGESTTIGKLLRDFGLFAPIAERIKNGMPAWGTCAGMILMAKKLVDDSQVHLGVMDISVRRNAYGSQLDSFTTKAFISDVSKDEIPLVFIRAPWVEKAQDNVNIMCTVNGKIVAVRQDNMIATSFHSELTQDISFHKYFAEMARKYIEMKSTVN